MEKYESSKKSIPTLNGGFFVGVYSKSGMSSSGNAAKNSSKVSKIENSTEKEEESHFKNLKDDKSKSSSNTSKNNQEPTT